MTLHHVKIVSFLRLLRKQ